MAKIALIFGLFAILFIFYGAEALTCYECSTDDDSEDQDLCGAYVPFNETEHIPVTCPQTESETLLSFCLKMTREPPPNFIWSGRWRTVIRRCSVGIRIPTGCTSGVDRNGVSWEECYCSSDGCNSS